MPASYSIASAPETLFERITNPVARARGGTYLALAWNSATPEAIRERIRTLLAADGWLHVAESADSLTLYGADADVDMRRLRASPVEAADGSARTLADFCALELRSAAPASSRGDRTQRSILSNLATILATQGVGLNVDLAMWPRVAESVVNFGVELPIGATASTEALQRFEGAVATAIRRFEPRLAGQTLAVHIVEPESALARGVLQMRIAADLKPAYGGDGVRFRTLIDLQTGKTTTEEESAHAGRHAQSV